MKSLLGLAWCAACAVGCVHDASVPTYTTVHIAVQGGAPMQPYAQGRATPLLSNVPDIPSVGGRVTAAQIEHALAGYGSWYDDPTYGEVWEPSGDVVGNQFVPYGTDGGWVPTDEGWYWQSSLSFGWLTFHYGRWVQTAATWAWVPGSMFAPAWVDWRMGSGWAGWAPLPPVGAPYAAPYAFCELQYLTYTAVWDHIAYGTAGSSIYPLTEAMMPSYGFGGAVYAWGPPTTAFPPSSQGPIVVQPIGNAWHAQFAPRAGVASQGGTGTPVATAQPIGMRTTPSGPGMGPSMPNMPTSATPWRPAPGPVAMPSTPSAYVASGPIRHTMTISSEPLNAGSWRNAEPVRVPSDPSAIGLGRYRTSDTVVIRSSVPEPMPSSSFRGGTEVGRSFGGTAYGGGGPVYGGGGGVNPVSGYAAHPAYGGGYPASAPSHPVSSGGYSAPVSYGAVHSFSAPAPAPAFHGGSFGRAGGRR